MKKQIIVQNATPQNVLKALSEHIQNAPRAEKARLQAKMRESLKNQFPEES